MTPTKDRAGDAIKMREATGIKNILILSTIPILRDASTLNKMSNAIKESGKIHKVPEEKTESGKPYFGRTKQSSPAKIGEGAKDGRDRTDAEIIDRYDQTSQNKELIKNRRQ